MKKINDDRKFLVERFGFFRSRAKLSARDLSLRMGRSEGYIAKFEKGGLNIPSEVLLDALKILNVTPQQFFCKDPNKFDEEMLVLERFEQLSSQKKEVVLKMLEIL